MKHLFLATLTALWAAAAHAGTFQITIADADGKPAPDVVVLLGNGTRSAPAAATPVLIEQEYSCFRPFLSVVPVGSTLRFTNLDNYDHHVRSTPSGPLGSTPPASSFELRLEAAETAAASAEARATRKRPPATTAEVKVDQPGPIGLGCHIHSSMRGQVYVSPTPWFAKTDASGVARIDNAPEGAVELTLWHPDQVQEQPAQRLQLAAAPAPAAAKLNFTPRRRRG